MKLSKKDEDKVYGCEGIAENFSYAARVINSCKNIAQLKNARRWGRKVIEQAYNFYSKKLNPAWYYSELGYSLHFFSYYREYERALNEVALKKEKEILHGQKGN